MPVKVISQFESAAGLLKTLLMAELDIPRLKDGYNQSLHCMNLNKRPAQLGQYVLEVLNEVVTGRLAMSLHRQSCP